MGEGDQNRGVENQIMVKNKVTARRDPLPAVYLHALFFFFYKSIYKQSNRDNVSKKKVYIQFELIILSWHIIPQAPPSPTAQNCEKLCWTEQYIYKEVRDLFTCSEDQLFLFYVLYTFLKIYDLYFVLFALIKLLSDLNFDSTSYK